MNSESIAQVLVVGAGPVGLTMACELARHGIRPHIIDRLSKPSPYCRALGVTPRTLEVWDDMGIAGDMIDAGIWITGQRAIINGQTRDQFRDLSDLPYSTLGLPQYETERLLTQYLASFGITIERGVSLEKLEQLNGQIQTTTTNSSGVPQKKTFQYVIGCDGAHSAVRKALGIAFEGSGMPFEFMLGDVHIDWNVPRGLAFRAIRPIPNAPPDLFVAIPLPEIGRYRVTMLAPPDLTSSATGTDHGIQSERPSPGLANLQAVADAILPTKTILTDLRWSSIFRISMRLAAKYRIGNAFIAGDAAHIHPPTGGQGMNTGIQDAYNLAWKLALVLKGKSPQALLDSYEAERRPVGADVLARTITATQNISQQNRPDDRLADTQILLSYRGTPWIENPATKQTETPPPIAGDRAPDCQGLHRYGVSFPIRLFDLLRGTKHVFISYFPGSDLSAELADLEIFLSELRMESALRFAVIADPGTKLTELPGLPIYQDTDGNFRKTYGPGRTSLLVRPDNHLACRGETHRDPMFIRYIKKIFLQSDT